MIEKLTPDDAYRFKAIRLRALSSDPDPFWHTAAEEAAFGDEHWRGRLADSDRATFVAEDDGEDVGLVSIGPSTWDADADRRDFDLSGMWVAGHVRGYGTASGLVRRALEFAAANRARRVTLWVLDENTRANKFYEKFGFTPTGRTGVFPPPRNKPEHERAVFV